MKKTNIFIASFVAIVVLGLVFLLSTSDEEQDIQSTQPVATMPNQDQGEAEQATNESERYVQYSENSIAEAEGQVVLFFHASWCPQCVQLENDLKQRGVPEGYTFIEVDFDNSQELRERYGVTIQTTLILIDENQEEIDRFVPYEEPTVEAIERDFLST